MFWISCNQENNYKILLMLQINLITTITQKGHESKLCSLINCRTCIIWHYSFVVIYHIDISSKLFLGLMFFYRFLNWSKPVIKLLQNLDWKFNVMWPNGNSKKLICKCDQILYCNIKYNCYGKMNVYTMTSWIGCKSQNNIYYNAVHLSSLMLVMCWFF